MLHKKKRLGTNGHKLVD